MIIHLDRSDVVFNWGMWVYTIHLGVLLLLTGIGLVRKYKDSKGLDRIKIQYLLLGISLSALGALITNLILPVVFNIFYLLKDDLL